MVLFFIKEEEIPARTELKTKSFDETISQKRFLKMTCQFYLFFGIPIFSKASKMAVAQLEFFSSHSGSMAER